MTSKNHKKVCTTLNYIEHILILTSTTTECMQISAFASLIGTPTGIKKNKSILKKKKEAWKIVFLAKSKLNSIEVLISKVLINSNINHDEFVLINVLK